MKICVVHVNCEEVSGPYAELIDRNFNQIKRDDTELVHRFVGHLKRATDTVFAYPTLLNRVDVVERFIEADREGFDAAMVACSGDPGVAEARSIAGIPIIGPMEASLHLACTYGHKIGIVTVEDRSWAEYCDMMVGGAGLRDRLSGIGRIAIPSKEAFTSGFLNPEGVADEIERVAARLVDDGANAIVIGSAGLSVIASTVGLSRLRADAVPIFDCLSIGLKSAELRADLTQKLAIPEYSRVGFGTRMEENDVERLRSLFAIS